MQNLKKLLPHLNHLQQWLPISLILLLAASLYLYALDRRGLWIDEFISIIDAQKLEFNRGRLLYYVLLHFWMTWYSSDAWLRGLSVVFALLSVWLIYRLGCYLFNESTGLVSALMLALSPLFINHAQEVRYYTMSTCLGIAGTLALAQALAHPNALVLRLGWVAMRFLAIITTPLNAVLLFPDLLVIGVKFRKQPAQLWAFGQAFLLILSCSIIAAISVAASSGEHRLSPPIPGIQEVLRELRILTVFPYPPSPPYLAKFLQIFIFLLLGLIGIALVQKPRSEKLFWVASWTFLPLGIMFIFSHLFFSIWISRYLMLISPYLMMILAIGFLKIYQKRQGLGLIVVIIYLITVSSGLSQYYTTSKRYMGAGDHYRSVVEIINKNEKPGDIIVWSIIHRISLPLEHYHRGSAIIHIKDRISSPESNPDNIKNWLDSLPAIPSRLWLIYGSSSETFCHIIEEQFDVIETYEELGKCSMFLLQPKSKN